MDNLVIKNVINITHSLGDIYLKLYNDMIPDSYNISQSFINTLTTSPYLTSDPEIIVYQPHKSDEYMILCNNNISKELNDNDVNYILKKDYK